MSSSDGCCSYLLSCLAGNRLQAWTSFPSEKVTGLVVQSVKVNGASVSFIATELMMSKFDLTLDASGILKGTITNKLKEKI
jgi:hypothetical protein